MPDATAPSPAPLSKSTILFRRLISTVILWTIVLTALLSSNKIASDYVFVLAMVFLAFSGLGEFYGMVEKRGLACFRNWGILGGAMLMLGTFLQLTGHIGTQGSPARVNDFETSQMH